jgi:hypothetical protein
VKRFFGSLLLRLIRGGVLLRKGEHQIVSAMVAELPDHLRNTVECQFNEYNIVQRETDGRALNFYKMGLVSAKPLKTQAMLQGNSDNAPLIRVSVFTPGEVEPLHAALTAVAGRVFCASFSRPVPEAADERAPKVTQVIHAWRATFPARGDA